MNNLSYTEYRRKSGYLKHQIKDAWHSYYMIADQNDKLKAELNQIRKIITDLKLKLK
jgi:hypothetical protein